MTTIVALVFLIPLGIAVQRDNRDDALAAAARSSGIVAGALAVTTDTSRLGAAIKAAGGDIHVHGIEAGTKSRAAGVDIERASAGNEPIVVDIDGGALRLEPVKVGDRIAVIEVFVSDAALRGGSGRTWLILFGIALALVIVTVIVVDRIAGRAVTAARTLAKAAVGLGDGDLTTRVRPSGPQELAEAGLAFNRMAERLSVTRTDEFELVADLSHRLRTPLTVLRLDADALDSDDTSIGSFTEAELDRRRTIRRIRQAIVTLEGEIDVLIKTTRKTISQDAGPGSCDASEVVRERMVFWSQLADDQNRPHRVVGAHTRIQVPVPRAELAAALDAVIGNVFRYTPQSTAFEVAISRRDGYVAVRVDDAGPGIANPERALRRGASDRGSTGLGLDIAKRVTLTAHGSVSIDRAQLGGASVVMLLRDPDAPEKQVSRFGLVGRLAREPVARRRQKRRSDHD